MTWERNYDPPDPSERPPRGGGAGGRAADIADPVTPVYGDAIPAVIGTGRVKAQLVFRGVPGGTLEAGTVAIGEVWQAVTARFAEVAVYAICEAPVADVLRHWNGPVPAAGLARDVWDGIVTATGTVEIIKTATAAAWSALIGTDAEGMGFSGTCHARVSKMLLRPDDGSPPELEFEVKSNLASAASPDGLDCLAADAFLFVWTDAKSGLGRPLASIDVEHGADGSVASSYRRHCEQRGLWVSRVLVRGEKKNDVLESLLDATDATLIEVDGIYRVIPLPDRTFGTFTPDLRMQAIGDDDFFYENGDHLRFERLNPVDRNVFPIEYQSRGVDYHTSMVEGWDAAAVSQTDRKRADVLRVPWTITNAHAAWLAETLALRALTMRNRYTLRLKPKWAAILVATDFLSVSETKSGFTDRVMRVTSLGEPRGGSVTVEAVDWLSVESTGASRQLAAGLLSGTIIKEIGSTYGATESAQAAANAALAGAVAPNPNFDQDPASTWPTMTRVAKASAPTGCPTDYCGRAQSRDSMTATDGPVTPGKQIYVEAWVDTTLSTHGAHFGLAFLDSAGSYITWFGAAAPAATAWARYSDVITVPAGAIRARGWCQIDAADTFGSVYFTGLRVSEATAAQVAADAAQAAADAAQTDATQALGELTDIASDSLLTPVEKPPVIRDYDVIIDEQAGIDAQATAYGITSLKTAYDNAVSALTTYVGTLTTPVAWNNLTGNTTIVGATFRSKFYDVYTTRQALLDAIAANSFTQGQADSTSDTDNLWPNPSSEIAPPTGADLGRPEWQDRYNAGAGAYSGSWVRQAQTGAALSGFWLPCSPGATFYAEAQGRRTAGTATGGRLRIHFYSEYGNFGSGLGTANSSPNVSSGTWAKVAVTSAAAPAGATAVHIGYWADSGDTVQFDALYARRVMAEFIVQATTETITAGTNWTVGASYLSRVSGVVSMFLSASATVPSASWASLATLPVGFRPPVAILALGRVFDASSALLYVAGFQITTGGVVSVATYDNGTSLVGPFALATGDAFDLCVTFIL